MSISQILTTTGVTIHIKGHKPFTMARSHKYFDRLLDALRTRDEREVLKVINVANEVKTYVKNNLEVRGGEIFYKGELLTGALVDRILQMLSQDLPAEGMLKFLENLMENPSKQSREELYLFLEACGDLPITADGRFIAYKWVRDNYRDVHSGKFDNSVGQVVKMPRRDVDDDRRRTCSAGLHVCSQKYEKFGPRLMLVAVNPRDVVSVPNDYDNGKMRVCEYEVIEEVQEAEYTNFSSPVYESKQKPTSGPLRDSKGRFLKRA